MLLFGKVFVREIRGIKEIVNVYYKATCMEINMRKSTVLFNALGEEKKS
jgi:hypothetical protein